MKIQSHQLLSYSQIKKDNCQSAFMGWVNENLYNGRMTIKNANKALCVYGAAAASAIRN